MPWTATDSFFFKHNHYPKRRERTETNDERNDSIWAVVYCTAKNLGVSPSYVLNELSYINLLMYGHATPQYNPKSKEEQEWDDSIDANNPNNFKSNNDEEEFV